MPSELHRPAVGSAEGEPARGMSSATGTVSCGSSLGRWEGPEMEVQGTGHGAAGVLGEPRPALLFRGLRDIHQLKLDWHSTTKGWRVPTQHHSGAGTWPHPCPLSCQTPRVVPGMVLSFSR